MSDKKKRSRGVKVDGQPRVIEKNPNNSTKGTVHLYWVIPVIVVFLIVPLLIFHLGSGGGSDTAEEESATEETADSGEESGASEEGGEKLHLAETLMLKESPATTVRHVTDRTSQELWVRL